MNDDASSAIGMTVELRSVESPSVRHVSELDIPRRSALAAFFTAPWFPQRTAQQTSHLSLIRAFGLHLLAAISTLVVIVLLVALEETRGPLTLVAYMKEIVDVIELIIGEATRELERDGWEFVALVGLIAIGIEIGVVAVAILLSPWGARDERFRASIKHSVRRTWIQTSHVPLLVALIGLGIVSIDRAQRVARNQVFATMPAAPLAPTFPANQSDVIAMGKYAAAMVTYQLELTVYNRRQQEAWVQWNLRRPWYFRYSEEIAAAIVLGFALWLLVALIRAVGAPRGVPLIERPPMCENCGYNLTGMQMEDQCPECGEEIVLSLGADVREGSFWSRRERHIFRWRRWFRCAWETWRNPRHKGRRLPLINIDPSFRTFVALTMVALAFLGMLGFLLMVSADQGRIPLHVPGVELVFGSIITSLALVIGALLLISFAALVAGVGYAVSAKRNLLGGSIQMACYMSGYLALWTLFALISGAVLTAMNSEALFSDLARMIQLNPDVFAIMLWLLPNLAGLIYYFVLVSRGTAAMRFANR